MTSVERVMTYTKLDSEPGYKVDTLPRNTDHAKETTFREVSMMYYPGGPKALRNINLDIKGGSNIGVAGRTGAGKSSFAAALLRMPDLLLLTSFKQWPTLNSLSQNYQMSRIL